MSDGRRILVVDDEQDVREMLSLLLASRGYRVETAGDGMQALVAAQRETPDLILLDVMMSDMDGWEVLKLLQLEPRTREVPVVIASARAEMRDRIRGLQEGAVDYLTKPIAVDDLLARVAAILGERQEFAP